MVRCWNAQLVPSCLIGSALLLARPSVAVADEAKPGVRFEAAVRFGVSFPAGGEFDYYDNLLHQAYPIWLDLGARISELVFVGAYLSYAPTTAYEPFPSRADLCPSGCSIQDYRFGLEVEIHPGQGRWGIADFWVGLGGGYEIQHQTRVVETCCYSTAWVQGSIRGPEYLNLQVGLGFVLGNGLTLGPYVSASLAAYQVYYGAPIADPQLHWWFNVGLRLALAVGH